MAPSLLSSLFVQLGQELCNAAPWNFRAEMMKVWEGLSMEAYPNCTGKMKWLSRRFSIERCR